MDMQDGWPDLESLCWISQTQFSPDSPYSVSKYPYSVRIRSKTYSDGISPLLES